jgi:hypothetical protein
MDFFSKRFQQLFQGVSTGFGVEGLDGVNFPGAHLGGDQGQRFVGGGGGRIDAAPITARLVSAIPVPGKRSPAFLLAAVCNPEGDDNAKNENQMTHDILSRRKIYFITHRRFQQLTEFLTVSSSPVGNLHDTCNE